MTDWTITHTDDEHPAVAGGVDDCPICLTAAEDAIRKIVAFADEFGMSAIDLVDGYCTDSIDAELMEQIEMMMGDANIDQVVRMMHSSDDNWNE